MDDALHADAVDDDTVRVELDGETHDIAVAEQLSRELDAVIETLRSDQGGDPRMSTTCSMNCSSR